MNNSAYLILTLDITTEGKVHRNGLPVPKYCGIYSSPAEGLTGMPNVVNATIFRMEGNTYDEAAKNMRNFIDTYDIFEWARVWVDDSREGHMKRGVLMGYIDEEE